MPEIKYLPITIIIPLYKDSSFVNDKVKNIMALRYPVESVEIIFVHGGAKSERVEVYHNRNPLVKIIHTQLSGKVKQLNKAIVQARGQILLFTDIDADLDDHALLTITKKFEEFPDVGVVGAWTKPAKAHVFERMYWYVSNWVKVLETKFYTASHVAAPCMAVDIALFFHTGQFKGIPEDVVADDVYIPLRASFSGLRVMYIRSCVAREKRVPRNVRQILWHKRRKGNAFLRELLRFSYRIYDAKFRLKIIFFLRLAQFMITSGLRYPFFRQDGRIEKISH